jgi:maltose O-acetyltransferase
MKDKTGKVLTHNEIIQKGVNRMYSIIEEFTIYILHIIGYIPSHTIRRFFYRLSGIKIGKGSTIHMGARFYRTYTISIGEDSIIGEGIVLDGRDTLSIGNHVDIASDVMIYNSQHNINAEHFAAQEGVIIAPVVIEDYVFIGPRVIILPGVTIGKGAIVGAGAVVTSNVDAFSIVGGVPAKQIGIRKNQDLHYILGRARWFR